jgi:hypothetical protein
VVDDALPRPPTVRFGYDCPLSFGPVVLIPVVLMDVGNDPVIGTAKLMSVQCSSRSQ